MKSYNAKYAFGFVECAEAKSRFGRDVFIHRQQMGDLEVGTEITFSIDTNKEGMPQARDVLRIDGSRPGPPPPLPEGGLAQKKDQNGSRRGGKGRRRGGKGRSKGEAEAEGDEEARGEGASEAQAEAEPPAPPMPQPL